MVFESRKINTPLCIEYISEIRLEESLCNSLVATCCLTGTHANRLEEMQHFLPLESMAPKSILSSQGRPASGVSVHSKIVTAAPLRPL